MMAANERSDLCVDSAALESLPAIVFSNHFAREIVRFGRDAQFDRTYVRLPQAHEILRQASRSPNQDHQQTGRKWIERSRMTHAPHTKDATNRVHNVVSGWPRRFVNEQITVFQGDGSSSSSL